jgi:hypothetical protein
MARGNSLATPGDAAALAGLDWQEFEARYRELLHAHAAATENHGCVRCDDCRGCAACTFCRQSSHLIRCHYCVECSDCTDCSHCEASRGLLSCHHCLDCHDCMGSTYLTHCSALVQCNYCFGCVGLGGKDFHVLNQPCDRSLYFEITRKLVGALQP